MNTKAKNLLLILIGITAFSFSDIIGGYTSDYMDYGVGARMLAMGGAGRSIANDATAGYWNPAALPNVIDLNFSGMTTTLMGMTKYNQFSFSSPISETEVVAASYQGLGVDNMELHGQDGGPANSNPDGYFSTMKSSMMLSYGRKINESSNWGVTAKYGNRSVYTSSDGVLAFDLGYWADMGSFQFGGNIRNAFSYVWGDTSDQYETDFDCGANMRFDNLLISMDFSRLMRKNVAYYVGAEYDLIYVKDSLDVKLRGGINPNQLSFGVGLQTLPIILDYALLIRPESQDHIFSLGLSFDDNARKNNNDNADKWYKKVIEAIDNHDYLIARRLAHDGLKEFPDHVGLQHVEQNMSKVFNVLSHDFTRDENSRRLLQEAVTFYLKEDWNKSLEIIEYLVHKYDNKEAYEFRAMVERSASRVSKYKGKNIINIFMEDAMAAQMVDDSKTAIKSLEKVIYYEPDNFPVLKQLGKLYYQSHDVDNAMKYWKRAIKINPNDEELCQLMKIRYISKDGFSKIDGISQVDSEKIWGILNSNGILNAEGFITDKFNPGQNSFSLGLPSEYSAKESTLIAVIQQSKEAQAF